MTFPVNGSISTYVSTSDIVGSGQLEHTTRERERERERERDKEKRVREERERDTHS